MTLRLRPAAVLVLALVGASAVAQTLEPVPFPPYDPDVEWRPRVYPEYNCDPLPLHAPDPRELGLAAALAAAERRGLSPNGLGDALAWAERASDPAHIPVLKRIVEGYRCADFHVGIAFLAIEAAGEPSEYFLDYALDWAYDDKVAAWAMNALAARGDTTVYEALRASVLQAPRLGPRGRSLHEAFNGLFVVGVEWPSVYAERPLRQRLRISGEMSVRALTAVVYEGPDGPALSVMTTSGNTVGSRMRRDARRLARAYPSVMGAVLRAYQDTARVRLAARGVAPEHVPLFLDEVRLQGPELFFPETGPPSPPAVTQAAVRPTVCVDGDARGPRYPSGMALELSYETEEAGAVRVPYGPLNRLDGPWEAGPFAPAPPEVFDPGLPAHDRAFRVPLAPGETVSWTLLGRSVTADAYTERCDGTPPPAR